MAYLVFASLSGVCVCVWCGGTCILWWGVYLCVCMFQSVHVFVYVGSTFVCLYVCGVCVSAYALCGVCIWCVVGV